MKLLRVLSFAKGLLRGRSAPTPRPIKRCVVCSREATRMIDGRLYCGYHGREGR